MNIKEKEKRKEGKHPEDKLRFCAASRLSITRKHWLTAVSLPMDHPAVTNDGKQKATSHTAQNQNGKNKSGWDQGPLVCLSVINNSKSAFQGSYLSARGGRLSHNLKTKNRLQLLQLCRNFSKIKKKKEKKGSNFTRSKCATSAVAFVLTLYSGKRP